jgi:predicted metal-dependent phosphoesterase TrpH
VDNDWTLSINGKDIAHLNRGAELKEHFYPIPPKTIRKGNNQFKLRCNTTTDDITIGEVQVIQQSFREFKRLGTLRIKVQDSHTKKPIPARVTILDQSGNLPPLYHSVPSLTPTRNGIVYPPFGTCSVELPEGKYEIWASRGTEWGVDSKAVTVVFAKTVSTSLNVSKEVDTTGFVATDTHVHTLTYSGHGDSSVRERQVTLAAEGVELPIATDHNHNTDYAPFQKELGYSNWFTPVVGNEVSTPIGHFNAFPLDPKDSVPPHQEFATEKPDDWSNLIHGIRDKGAMAIILNHPRWPSAETGPFGKLFLNKKTGARANKTPFLFDAIELVNSTTPETPVEEILQDWFALLNHGDWIMAVGSSDSHTVGDRVGEGRTYVQCEDKNPAKIPIQKAAKALANGHSSVSLGLYLEALQKGKPVMGKRLKARNGRITLQARLACASWANPEKLVAYVNGSLASEINIPSAGPTPFDSTFQFDLEVPQHDSWIVFTAWAPNPTGGFHQSLMPALWAVTNPIQVDGDADGRWLSPRETAKTILKKVGTNRIKILIDLIEESDAAVAIQLYSILAEANPRLLEELAAQNAPWEEHLLSILEGISG